MTIACAEIQKITCSKVPIGEAINKADIHGLSGCDACVLSMFKEEGNIVSGIQGLPVSCTCDDCPKGTLRFPPGSAVDNNGRIR